MAEAGGVPAPLGRHDLDGFDLDDLVLTGSRAGGCTAGGDEQARRNREKDLEAELPGMQWQDEAVHRDGS